MEDFLGSLIALNSKIVNRFRIESRGRACSLEGFRRPLPASHISRDPNNRTRGPILLETTAASTRARDAFPINGHVAEFSSHAAHAAKNLAAQDEAATDSGAQGKHCNVVKVAGCTQPLLAQGGGIRVVFQNHPGAQLTLDLGLHTTPCPAVRGLRLRQQSSFRINSSRY